MKKILKCILLFILFCPRGYAQNQAKISFVNNDSTYDFGEIREGESATHKFEFKNTGNQDLSITDVKSDNKHLKFKWEKKAVKPGKKNVIVVTFISDEEDGGGSFKNDVVITSSASAGAYPFLHISGVVVPATQFTPRSKDTSTSIKIPLSKKKKRKTQNQ